MEYDSIRALAWLARRRHARALDGPAHRRPRGPLRVALAVYAYAYAERLR